VSNSALIVAHPGHELRVFGWMEQERPLYCSLTEGSGGAATSRIASTTRILEQVGATAGPVYGRYADRDVYRLLLDGRIDVFVEMAQELAAALIAGGIDCVAGDAAEGFNPSHDVCRFLIDGAVAAAQSHTGRKIRNLDFVLDSSPAGCPEALRGDAIWLRLDGAALDRKIEAAMHYAALRDEVQAALQRFGKDAFAVECLRPSTTALMIEQFEQELPAYERYGDIRVREGRYREIIRYRQHVLPVRAAIDQACQA
jgi:hypothetical protein